MSLDHSGDDLSVHILCYSTVIAASIIAFFFLKIFSRIQNNKMNENKSGDISDLDNLQNENLEKSIDFKKIKKEIEETLTEDQLKEEKRIESVQLAAIYELLRKQSEELNTDEFDEEQLKQQLNLYR